MRDLKSVENELISIGSYIRFFGRPEVKELPKILVKNEKIKHCLTGKYEGGYALLCVTNLRVLLIDKKPFFLTLEDIRYDMIMEIDFSHQFLSGQVRLIMPNKQLKFIAYKKEMLRQLSQYIQKRILEYRQQHISNHRIVQSENLPYRGLIEQNQSAAYKPRTAVADDNDIPISIIKAVHPYIQSTLTVRKQTLR